MGAEEDEVLESGRPPVPRRVWITGLVVAALALGALVAVREWPGSSGEPAVAPGPSSSVYQPPRPISLGTPVPIRAWPTAPSACGGSVDLPLVSSVPARERTGIKVLFGGGDLRTVDFDTGRSVLLPDGRLRAHEFITGLEGTRPYLIGQRCSATGYVGRAQILRVGAAGTVTRVGELSPNTGLLADGDEVWRVRWPDGPRSHGYLTPLGGHRVRLPAGFDPVAITEGVAVGNTQSRPGNPLLLVDAVTGRLRADLAVGETVAVGHGEVVWSDCDVMNIGSPCVIHRRAVSGGRRADCRLPRPPGFTEGVLSPDGRLLAFTLVRAHQDRRFDSQHPIPPSDIALLHLDTGALDIVPGIEIPAKSSPGLAFSADGHWLVIALDAGTKTRLLAWRPGLAHPYETRPIPGRLWGAPAIAVLPKDGIGP